MSDIDAQARAIFFSALDQTVEQRDAYVDDACRDDSALQARVCDLLRAHQDAGNFLGGSASVVATRALVSEKPGDSIGPYKLREMIAEGGMGVVYMAKQTAPVKRNVALKVIKPGMETKQVIGRFEAERQALALMDHPNIAKVFDAGATASGRPYFVMELVQGVSITDHCDRQHLAVRQRLELFITVCQAVQHAHQKGLIHRDIKPSNVLVALQDGRLAPKIIDFGVAKAINQRLTEDTLTTAFPQMVGTPLYMSPEQANMTDLDVDTRSDVYSLGVLLYELLTGSTPIEQQKLSTLCYDEIRRIIREDEAPRPSHRISTLGDRLTTVSEHRACEPQRLAMLVRGELDWIVMKCLEKDRTRRYQSCDALSRDLERYLNQEPVSACPPSASYRLGKFVQRKRWVVLTTSLVAVLLISATSVSTWLAVWAVKAQQLADKRLTAEEEARHEAVRERNQARRRLLDVLLSRARAARWSRRAGQRFEGLEALTNAAQLAREQALEPPVFLELRNEAIACMALVDATLADGWLDHSSNTAFIAFAPGLARIASSDFQGNAVVRDVRDGSDLFRFPRPEEAALARHLRFSRNGRLLAINWCNRSGSTSFVEVWRLTSSGQYERVLARQPVALLQRNGFLDFAPDGASLAIIAPDGMLQIIDLRPETIGAELLLPNDFRPNGAGVAFNCDGSRLALWTGDAIQIVNVATHNLHKTLPQPDGVRFSTWHPQDPHLLATCRFSIHVWDVSTGEERILRGHSAEIVDLAFGNFGDLLASRGWDGTIRLWNLWTGQELVGITGAYTTCYIQFGPDDRQLAFASNGRQFGLLEVEPPSVYRALQSMAGQGRGNLERCDISPDGMLLVAGRSYSPSDGLSIWDLPSGHRLMSTTTGGAIFGALFDSSGKGVYSSGAAGLRYWPIRSDANHPDLPLVGEPKTIGPNGPFHRIAISRDGRKLGAVVFRQEARVFEIERQLYVASHEAFGPPHTTVNLGEPTGLTNDPVRLPHPGVSNLALSPDGRFVATGTWQGNSVKVWDTITGECLKELPDKRSANVAFSADGCWLATSTGQELCLYEVGSWRAHGRRVRSHVGNVVLDVSFSPDSKLLAAAASREQVELIDPQTTQLLAVLVSPDSYGGTGLSFTPDGTQLVVRGAELQALHVWNLKLLRQNLAAMGLDFDQPPHQE